jgi:hypothetical protein
MKNQTGSDGAPAGDPKKNPRAAMALGVNPEDPTDPSGTALPPGGNSSSGTSPSSGGGGSSSSGSGVTPATIIGHDPY